MSVSIGFVQRKDKINRVGSAPIRLRITIDRTVKYISTGISVPTIVWNQDSQRIDESYPSANELQLKLDSIKVKWLKKIKRMESFDEAITFQKLMDRQVTRSTCTVGSYFEQQVSWMQAVGKIGTASKYRYCLKLLQEANSVRIRFEEIDVTYLKKFEAFLVKKGNMSNSIATKFSVLRAVYNKAAADGVFIVQDDPFKKFKLGRLWKPTRKRAITKEEILRISRLEIQFNPAPYSLSFARDIFLFSYYVAGINFKDIATLRYENIVGDRIYYQRHKTGKELNNLIIPEVRTILSRYSVPRTNERTYVFPILDASRHLTEQQIYNRLQKISHWVNANLKQIAMMAEINAPLTTYVARHTFATVLKRSGVSTEIISESLGHSDVTTTQIYLDSFENSQIDEAMKNLL